MRQHPHATTESADSSASDDESADDEPSLDHSGTPGSRFVGDLNPKCVFMTATSPDSNMTSTHDDIGVWLATKATQDTKRRSRRGSYHRFAPTVQQTFLPYLEDECVSLLPPQADLEALCSIYFKKVHPLLPAVDEIEFGTMQDSEPEKIMLQQTMCLVAATDPVAKDHLRLPSFPYVMTYSEFGQRISAAIKTALDINLVTDKIVLIQTLALLTFHMEGPDGGEISAANCALAVHYAQTVGLHIGRSRRGPRREYSETLFCCVWALDRLNAAFHGRPVLIHEHDLSINLQACIAKQTHAFRIFLQVIALLDKVITLYRPTTDLSVTGWEEGFPGFEELVADDGGCHVDPPVLGSFDPTRSDTKEKSTNFQHAATIETLYHAVAILSCRARSSHEAPRSTASSVRQSLSATRVTSVVGQEFNNQLSMLPIIPYAVSLSLSVAYRELRNSKIPMYRSRARALLQKNCSLLRELGGTFWSAEAMARLGEKTLKEMDRVYSSITGLRIGKQRQLSNASAGPAVSCTYPEGTATASSPIRASFSPGMGTGIASSDVTPGQQMAVQFNSPSQFDDRTRSMWSESFVVEQAATLMSSMTEIDIFSQFDSNFDLEGIDAVLAGNLSLSFPINYERII